MLVPRRVKGGTEYVPRREILESVEALLLIHDGPGQNFGVPIPNQELLSPRRIHRRLQEAGVTHRVAIRAADIADDLHRALRMYVTTPSLRETHEILAPARIGVVAGAGMLVEHGGRITIITRRTA